MPSSSASIGRRMRPSCEAINVVHGLPSSIRPASFLQRQEFAYSVNGLAFSSIAAGWILRGELDLDAAVAAIRRMGEHHETLRTALAWGPKGSVVQRVVEAPLDFVDVTNLESAILREGPCSVRLWAVRQVRQPFRLQHAPHMRVGLARLGSRAHVLLLAAAHTIWDAACIRIFITEFGDGYASALGLQGRASPPAIQFGDIAAAEAMPPPEAAAKYWRQRFKPRRARLAPFVAPSEATLGSYVPAMAPIPSSAPGLAHALSAIADRVDARMSMTITAAVVAIVGQALRQDDVVIGLIEANRHDAATARLIACVMNVLLIRVPTARTSTFLDVLVNVRQETTQSRAHSLPLRQQLQAMGVDPEARLSRDRLCDAAVNVRGEREPDASGRVAGTGIRTTHFAAPTPWIYYRARRSWIESPMDFNVLVSPNGVIHGHICFDTRRLERRKATALGARLATYLQVVTEKPEEPVLTWQDCTS